MATPWKRNGQFDKREHECHANHQVLRFENIDTVLYLSSTPMCCVLDFTTAVDRVH